MTGFAPPNQLRWGCVHGHTQCADYRGGPCSQHIVDRQPRETIDSYCTECGGTIRLLNPATRLGWLYECDGCGRKVYGH